MSSAGQVQRVSSFDLWKLTKKVAFFLLVVFIVVVMVFPFYYAILTSFKSGTNLFKVSYWPEELNLANYLNVLQSAAFLQNLANSIIVATLTVLLSLVLSVTASYALSRVNFRGRGILPLALEQTRLLEPAERLVEGAVRRQRRPVAGEHLGEGEPVEPLVAGASQAQPRVEDLALERQQASRTSSHDRKYGQISSHCQ